MIRQHGNSAIVIASTDLKVIEFCKTLPGRYKWKENELWIHPSVENIECLLEAFPFVKDRNVPLINDYLDQKGVADRLRILREQGPPPEASVFPFKTEPYEHQRKAFALSRNAEIFALFMEMGTGKTKILIDTAFSLWMAGAIDSAVVVAPNGVHRQWIVQQLPIHAPEYPWWGMVHKNHMSQKDQQRWDKFHQFQGLRFLSFSFSAISASERSRQALSEFLLQRKCLLILDESHKIKSQSARVTKFLLSVSQSAKYKRIATGTPLTKGLEDLYPQMQFLSPSILGLSTFTAFKKRYCVEEQIFGVESPYAKRIVEYQNQDDLMERISKVVHYVKKEDCLDLPDKIYRKIPVEMTKEQAQIYHALRTSLLAELDNGTVIEVPMALARIAKMQQVLSGHVIDEEGVPHHIHNNRERHLVDWAEEAGRGVVWVRYRADAARAESVLGKAGFKVVTYHGGTSQQDRRNAIAGLQNGSADILVANPASAGTGLNLSFLSNSAYYSHTHNSAERWQSEDRIHRIGQSHGCTYTDFYCQGTLEEKILERQLERKLLADSFAEIRYLLSD